jgi:hypothetical protein
MKNVRFYLEYQSPQDKRKNKNSGNCVAVLTDYPSNLGNVSTICSVMSVPNSSCMFCEVSINHIQKSCKRVSEDVARIIHPNLFYRLGE